MQWRYYPGKGCSLPFCRRLLVGVGDNNVDENVLKYRLFIVFGLVGNETRSLQVTSLDTSYLI